MDFNHIMNVIDETNMNNIVSDIPLAIFMIKILATKIKFHNISHSTDEGFSKYMKSDKPIRLRYYLQVTIKDEIKEGYDKKIDEMNNELERYYIIFKPKNSQEMPSYKDRMYIYNNYLKDINDEKIKSYEKYFNENGRGQIGLNLKDKIDKWKYDYENSDVPGIISVETLKNDIKYIYEIVHNLIIEKYRINRNSYGKFGFDISNNIYVRYYKRIYKILEKFNTIQSVEDLLYSIKDVITIGLSPSS
jgi:hypothetical protein